ncbi:unnamed protein product [Vitrella brassicaformis CCMP3155]|uniref:Uncharacterized protein n=1 Tax=Vitrella brassicaformis (strain CCMP3155) TaxID=1169540 RepID=A0A0G4GZV8_VITBC|nr:unnamed protein product [Vitrella brassicaformis CCMP3155]|eukprot:CEM36624.1 unnamed protein product [Vitrella brassicaformis CCMP3155]
MTSPSSSSAPPLAASSADVRANKILDIVRRVRSEQAQLFEAHMKLELGLPDLQQQYEEQTSDQERRFCSDADSSFEVKGAAMKALIQKMQEINQLLGTLPSLQQPPSLSHEQAAKPGDTHEAAASKGPAVPPAQQLR